MGPANSVMAKTLSAPLVISVILRMQKEQGLGCVCGGLNSPRLTPLTIRRFLYIDHFGRARGTRWYAYELTFPHPDLS